MTRRSLMLRLAPGAGLLALCLLAPRVGAFQADLPASLTDKEFWELSERMSEPNGTFLSDNLVSNETALSSVAAALVQRVKAGGVYLGVGPEQNFTYIAAIRPRIAFINDIRRGNLHMHLMYKALFELAADRAEFVSRLFTKPRPGGLTPASTGADLMNAYWDVQTSDESTFRRNLQDVHDLLVKKHGLPLSKEDLDGVATVYYAFYYYGPRITYSSSTRGPNATGVSYADLMMTRDAVSGEERSYLATEDAFVFLKAMQSRNLIVPLVGDFAGPKALRAVGTYVRERGATITAFYVSNVESYLYRNGVWPAFCGNVATFPLEEGSVFIRPMGAGGGTVVLTATVQGSLPLRNPVLLNGVVVTPNQTMTPAPTGRGAPFGAMAAETAGCK
ncbi:MAG TPA: hypothetical protein VFO31_17060 [Vicinamibacterales bacterium]|nr:hypothetical protein [Vicinamibacterales bacterium]